MCCAPVINQPHFKLFFCFIHSEYGFHLLEIFQLYVPKAIFHILIFCYSFRLVATIAITVDVVVTIVIENSKATLKRDTFLCQTSERNNAKFEYILIYIATAMATRKMREWKECMARVRTIFTVCCLYAVWYVVLVCHFLYVLQHAFYYLQ